jgi:hypothetical protein
MKKSRKFNIPIDLQFNRTHRGFLSEIHPNVPKYTKI